MKAVNKRDEELPSSKQPPPQGGRNGLKPQKHAFFYEQMQISSITPLESHAVFASLMGRPGLIERFDFYKRVELVQNQQHHPNTNATSSTSSDDNHGEDIKEEVDDAKEIGVAIIKIGDKLNGHVGIIHGGIVSLLMDEAFGWGVEILYPPASETFTSLIFTGNLSVHFRHALTENTTFIIRIFHDKTMGGRKIYLRARAEDLSPKEHEAIARGEVMSMLKPPTLMEKTKRVVYSEATSLFIVSKNKSIKRKTFLTEPNTDFQSRQRQSLKNKLSTSSVSSSSHSFGNPLRSKL